MSRVASWIVAGVALAMLGGCTGQQRAALRGEQTRRDIYLNLMTAEEAKRFRELEAAEVDEQVLVLYCQEVGAYQKWLAVPPEVQETIRKGRVAEGMTKDEVQMAWGPPAAVEETTSEPERLEGHKREVWRLAAQSGKAGEVQYRREARFLDERLAWYKDFEEAQPWWRWRWPWQWGK